MNFASVFGASTKGASWTSGGWWTSARAVAAGEGRESASSATAGGERSRDPAAGNGGDEGVARGVEVS